MRNGIEDGRSLLMFVMGVLCLLEAETVGHRRNQVSLSLLLTTRRVDPLSRGEGSACCESDVLQRNSSKQQSMAF